MHVGLDDEEYALLRQIVAHYALQLAQARDRCADLQRRLDCANARIEVLEGIYYGVSFL